MVDKQFDLRTKLKDDFSEIYGDNNGVRMFFAPGRINLIGEHTDYNGGYVFPCALSFGTYCVARKTSDRCFKVYSEAFPQLGVIEFDLEELNFKEEDAWANYVKGVIKEFIASGEIIETGLEMMFYGNIPKASGLSSSASLELSVAVALKELFSLELDMLEMVKICQRAENEFIGVKCGIMDQFAIGMGRKNQAILLDCNTLNYEYSRIDLGEHVIVIANTNKGRGLSDSQYNTRRAECDRALKDLQNEIRITALGELDEDNYEKNKHLIIDDISRKRAKHAVYENGRTLKAVKALNEGNLYEFGQLMNESHMSLKEDYEVTGKELDTLVQLSWNHDASIGSRMTGAGFGGCTISIVKKDAVDEFIESIGEKYAEVIGYEAEFYVAEVGEGAREIL